MGKRQRARARAARQPLVLVPQSMADLADLADAPMARLEAVHSLLAREHTSLIDRMIVPRTRAEPRPGISDEQWELMSGRFGEVGHMMDVVYGEIRVRRGAGRAEGTRGLGDTTLKEDAMPMDTSTRLPGHGLLAKGKPFEDDCRGGVRRADIYGEPDGFGVCSCGERSGVLGLDADRKRWHKAHKDEARLGLPR
jgi:hypothetical protein